MVHPSNVSFAEALRFWFKLGFISLGGPAGQFAIMHRELVERREWISEERFLYALNFCMLLPGPEAQQLAIYIGRRSRAESGRVVRLHALFRTVRVYDRFGLHLSIPEFATLDVRALLIAIAASVALLWFKAP